MSNLPPAIKLYKGVSIYKVTGSPYWYVRVWDRQQKKYVVKSTGEESSLLARDVAQDVALSLLKKEKNVAPEYTFKHFGLKILNNMQREARLGNKSPGYVKSLLWAIQNEDWGLLNHFGSSDVRDLKTHSFQEYMAELTAKRPDIKASTKNTLMAAFRNVLKVARDEGLIDVVPHVGLLASKLEGKASTNLGAPQLASEIEKVGFAGLGLVTGIFLWIRV